MLITAGPSALASREQNSLTTSPLRGQNQGQAQSHRALRALEVLGLAVTTHEVPQKHLEVTRGPICKWSFLAHSFTKAKCHWPYKNPFIFLLKQSYSYLYTGPNMQQTGGRRGL